MQRVSAYHAAAAPGLDPLGLAGTLCARLCHDLAGSAGALTTALEVAVEEGDRDALDLALAVSRELSARLQVLRAAWSTGSEMPPLENLVAGLPGAERLRVDLGSFRASDAPTLRLALSLLLVAAAGLRRGGEIRLGGSDARFVLQIEGLRAEWPESLASSLASEAGLLAAAAAPREVSVALACLQARALGREMILDSPTRLTVIGPG